MCRCSIECPDFSNLHCHRLVCKHNLHIRCGRWLFYATIEFITKHECHFRHWNSWYTSNHDICCSFDHNYESSYTFMDC
jgi:hypothetical protein